MADRPTDRPTDRPVGNHKPCLHHRHSGERERRLQRVFLPRQEVLRVRLRGQCQGQSHAGIQEGVPGNRTQVGHHYTIRITCTTYLLGIIYAYTSDRLYVRIALYQDKAP